MPVKLICFGYHHLLSRSKLVLHFVSTLFMTGGRCLALRRSLPVLASTSNYLVAPHSELRTTDAATLPSTSHESRGVKLQGTAAHSFGTVEVCVICFFFFGLISQNTSFIIYIASSPTEPTSDGVLQIVISESSRKSWLAGLSTIENCLGNSCHPHTGCARPFVLRDRQAH